MTAKINIGSVTMPAGRYYVGDPCYAFADHGDWMEWLTAAGIDEQPIPKYMVADFKGYPVIGVGTAYGDGCYYGDDGNEYGVDAGMIGAVPVEVATDGPLSAMQLVVFSEPFEVVWEEDRGTISIGHISIETDPPGWDTDGY